MKISNNGGGIGDIRLYLNDSAIVLDDSKSRNQISGNTLEKTYKLKLNNGENKVKVIAFNSDNSMQSNEIIKTFDLKKTNIRKPSLYALIIGINEYTNPAPYPGICGSRCKIILTDNQGYILSIV